MIKPLSAMMIEMSDVSIVLPLCVCLSSYQAPWLIGVGGPKKFVWSTMSLLCLVYVGLYQNTEIWSDCGFSLLAMAEENLYLACPRYAFHCLLVT